MGAQGDGGANDTQLAPTTAPWAGDLGQENTGNFSPGQTQMGGLAAQREGEAGRDPGRNREGKTGNGPSEDQGQTSAAVTEHCQPGAPRAHCCPLRAVL